ncbi:amidohydrolase family protein [Alloalcanivorax mobilis]|uniref:amidohydrolase family protein n=1 Tax=Alloalcanivorax mobilis TaxID=2019569 RepID=UPI000C76F089|nr:amidohydrolase family protein [Alloalcanivorax mobilis]
MTANSESRKVILPAPDTAWLARHREPVLEPERAIIDPHHHLWGPPRPVYLGGEIETDLNSGHNVRATVFVECSEGYYASGDEALRPVGETVFARGFAEASRGRVCAGIVGHADLRQGAAVETVLQAHIEAGKGYFRGIRQSSVWDPDPAIRTTRRVVPPQLLLDPEFRQGFARLAPLGLSFDCWCYFHQIDDLIDLARAFPDTVIVLDHVGGVLGIGDYAGRSKDVFQHWRGSIETLAGCPNVRIKLGGLGMHSCGFAFSERSAPPDSQTLAELWRPYIQVCVEAFGAERAMFESNFPVDQVSCSYGVLWNAFKRLAADASESEKRALFHDTAERTYRLAPPAC